MDSSKLKLKLILVMGALAVSAAWAAPKEIKVHVNGMVCAFCSQGVTKKLKAKEAVQDVLVDMDKKEVRLTVKEGKELSDDEITSAIKDAGINVEKIVR